jgi:hypothetical protein
MQKIRNLPPVLRLTLPRRGVEVVTRRVAGGYTTVIHGGPLDGESWPARTVLGALCRHRGAEDLVKSIAE